MGIIHFQNTVKRHIAFPVSAHRKQTVTGGGAGNVFLLYANDHTGHRAYYFLQVTPLRVPQFKKALQDNAVIDLESYGEILATDYGDASEDVKVDIRARYGWEG